MNWWCVACGGSTTGGTRPESWSYRTSADPSEAKVFWAHVSRTPGACDNLVPADWRRRSGGHDLRRFPKMKITNEPRRFIEAVTSGGNPSGQAQVQQTRSHKNAAVRDGVDEVTLHEGEEGTLCCFINTTPCGRQWMQATARGRGLACNASGHLQRRPRDRNGESLCTSSWRRN